MGRSQPPRPEPAERPARPGPGDAEGWPVYSLFGLSLATDFPFANHLVPGRHPPDLVFHCTDAPLDDCRWQGPPVFISPYRNAAGQPVLLLHRAQDDCLVRFTGIADFVIAAQRIDCHAADPGRGYLVEICFLGTVMALFLESRGVLSLHGSVIRIELGGEAGATAGQEPAGSGAVAFLAGSRGGKSCLAASFLRAGHALLSDDILAVSASAAGAIIAPAYPQMRLEPAEVEHFRGAAAGATTEFPLVHPDISKRRVPVGEPGGLGRFCLEPQPRRASYFLDREPSGGEAAPITVTPLRGAQAVAELMRQAFEPEITEAMGFQPRRLQALAALCRTVPVRRLAFPSGFDRLPEVREAVLADRRRYLRGR